MGLYGKKIKFQFSQNGMLRTFLSGMLLSAACTLVTSCGSSGYAGQPIASLSASQVTIDAGQSFAVTASDPGNLPLTWTLSGSACTGATCGAVSSTSGVATTYTAPSPLSTQMVVTLQAAALGTQSSKTVTITVNPAPAITGATPNGTVGVAFSATLTASGGTGKLTLSQAGGSLPAGLTFNPTTGVISGTPTTTGTSSFVVQVVDTSDVPDTVTASRQITIGTAAAVLAIGGNPPTGVVGTAYSSALTASGGTGPYTYALLSGSLPAGLTLSSAGLISGTPTASGTSTFTAQVQDASGTKATGNFGISVASTTGGIVLTTGTLPNGTVGTPYTGTIGVTGGTAPYTCSIAGGALPSGLGLSSACVVSGTPTTPGTSSVTVRATDSGGNTTTGNVGITINAGTPTITTGTLPTGTAGTPYSGTIGVSGGTAPYTCTVNAGTLPAGLTLGAGCVVSGTPTTPGTSTVTVGVTDSGNPPGTTTGPVSITINPAGLNITSGTLPNGTVGTPYSSTVAVSGGTAPYTCTVVSGSLPTGLAFGAGCTVTGTPTIAGTSTPTVRATDSSNPALSTTKPISITINSAAATIVIASPPAATVNTPYTGTIPVSGGTGPYTCALTGGTLPTGLSLNSNCQIVGTPTSSGSTMVTVKATDSSSPTNTNSGPVTITVNPGSASLTFGTPPAATINTPYTGTIPVAGGTAPYACALTGGTLQTGLTLNANCTITGTPTVAGTSTITVKGTDSANPANTSTGSVAVTVNPAAVTLTLGAPPAATINTPYSGTIPVSGGTAPYTCVQTGGTLQAGLALNANCTITGTPTVSGTSNITVKATDSASPANTNTASVPVTVNTTGATLTLGTPPAATINTPYTGTIPVSGGTAPYTCALTGGTLQAGLTLNANCTLTGTPTVSGTNTITVKATDTANPANTTTGSVPVTVNPAAVTLTLGTPPAATINTPYTGTIPVSGGTAPYTCALTGGTLQAGLTLNTNCTITGTPTVSGTSNITVKATDSANPADTNTGSVAVTVNPAAATLTLGTPPAGTINKPYTGTVPVSGGTAPYTCALTGGTLQAGLTLNTNCTITGTPTVSGTSTVTVKATDSANPANTITGSVPVTINPAAATLTIGTPPIATVTVPYTGTIPVTGGTGPYTCTVVSGTLPAGLTLGAGCVLSGTPTTVAVTTVGITATDSANPVDTTTSPVAITVQAIPALTLTGSLPNGIVNVPYSQTLQATGGVGPYTYAITAGALPAGLTLSTGGVISGTPTTVGASSFTVTATDSEGTPKTASLPLVLLITYPTTPSDALLTGPYAFLFKGYDDVVLGVLAYQTSTIGSFTANGAGVLGAGELDTNHQASIATGNTVPTHDFLGTYTVGTDGRGNIAITTLNADGTTGATTVYAIALRLPATPGTAATSGALIEYDGNQLAGTKGSGTLLAQTPSAINAGLTGSYAFGVSGDTPCLLTCTLSLLTAGPVVEVGQFTAAGGAITGGTADTNSAAINFPNSTLSGTYATADANGRVQLTLNTSRLAGTVYPTDFAVYIVDANNAFVMSTDKHSAFVLQAGTAKLQTQATFTNASLGAPYVGYENAQANPGLVSGTVLQSVLNFSSATIFEGIGNGDGTCTTRSVTNAGLTGLVNSLTGLLGNTGLLPTILGSYTSTGTAGCVVQSNGRATISYAQPPSLLGISLGSSTPAPRVAYLVSPEAGYFLETSYAGLGMLEAQTGAPFTPATLNGTFVYSTIPASTLATIDASGAFTADGAGHTTSLLDENLGIGTLNVLQLGFAGSATYTLTPQPAPYDPAQVGEYTLSDGTTIYAISPGRFVLLNPGPVSTSPYIVLLF